MGNIKIPYGFNTIEGTELRTVKLRISLNRIGCGSSEDHQRRGSAWVAKFYNQLELICADAGLTFWESGRYIGIEGVTTSTMFYLKYKSIMANADAYTARLESLYWEAFVPESNLRSIDSLKANGDKFVSQTEPDEDGRYTLTWKRLDGSTFESHHGPEPDSSESEFAPDDAVYLRQTQPDADGRYTMTWRLRDGSIHQTRHNLYE